MQHPLKEQLLSGEIHWWFSSLDESALAIATEADLGILSSEERDKRDSFRYEYDRSLYTETHLLLRFALSQYLDKDPASLQFKNGDFGRPEIDCPTSRPHIRFSMSHTKGLVTCAFVLEDDIGVDVEQNVSQSFPEVSQGFASSEQLDLAALPTQAQPKRFLEYWTLKESYLKASGLGLQLPMDSFWFLKADDRWNLQYRPDVEGFPDDWTFEVLAPTATHVAALAVRSQHRANPTIRFVSFDRQSSSFSMVPSKLED